MGKQAAQQYINTVRMEENEEIQRILAKLERDRPELVLGMSSIIGSRENQQDSSFGQVDGSMAFAVVCDGMGGLKGGEQASQTAVKMLVEDYYRLPEEGLNQTLIPQFFYNEVQKMDAAVHLLSDEDGHALEAGTTIVAVIIKEGSLYWCSVGDSKIYILRGDEIISVVREHNYRLTLDDRLAEGSITKEEYKREEKKAEALISFLGLGNVTLMDINTEPFPLENGDIVLLCSDGLYKALEEDIILGVIQSGAPNLQLAANRLTEAVLEKKLRSQDNTSVVLVQYHAK